MLARGQLGEHVLEHVRIDELLFLEQRAAERRRHVARRLKALVRILGQRAHHDFFELGGQLAHVGAGRLDEACAHGLEQLLPFGRAVQRAGREQLVKNYAERVNVGAPRDAFAARLLGRHVRGLALEHARLLAEQVGRGDAEIGDFHRAVEAQQDVLRRHVAVHDVDRLAGFVLALVRVVQPLGHLGDDVSCHVGRNALALGLRERISLRRSGPSTYSMLRSWPSSP